MRRRELDKVEMLPPSVVGVCSHCGRQFQTMPRDRLDHYGLPRHMRKNRNDGSEICGGVVISREAAEDRVAAARRQP